MASTQRKAGSTSVIESVYLTDDTGAAMTGLAYNTASLTCYYKKSDGTASAALTLANITTLGTFVSGGFKEIDATNLPGWYEFHPSNTSISSGTKTIFTFTGAASLNPTPFAIELTANDNQDAVRGGMTALPNANAGANGGLLTCTTGNVLPDNSIARDSFHRDTGLKLRLHGQVVLIGSSGQDTIPETTFNTTNYPAIAAMDGLQITIEHYTQPGVYFRTNIVTHDISDGELVLADNLPWTANANVHLWVDYSPMEVTAAGVDEDTLAMYVGLMVRSDGAIATDLSAKLAKINFDHGTGAGSYAPGTESLGNLYAVAADVSNVVNHVTYGNLALEAFINTVYTIVSDLPTTSETQAMFDALNQSAARRVLLATSLQWEVPESGSNTFTIQLKCYDGDGVPTNADSDPSIAITGVVTGDLSTNLSTISNPATGVYKWTYTLPSGSTVEQVEITATPTIGGTDFPVSTYPIVCDFVAATYTTTDRTKLEAIYDKLPSKSYIAGTSNSDGDVQLDEATGALPWNAAWDAEVQSEVQDALEANHLDHLLAQTYDPASKPGAADALLNELVGNDGGVSQFTANALELAPSGGGLTLSDARKAALESILDLSVMPASPVVVDAVGNTSLTFKTNMTTANGFADLSGRMVGFGPTCATTANRNQVRTIVTGGHNLTTGVILVHEAFGAEPAAADVLTVPGASREE